MCQLMEIKLQSMIINGGRTEEIFTRVVLMGAEASQDGYEKQ